MQTISMDLRLRVFRACDEGSSTDEAAEQFSVSPAFVRRLMQRYRASGLIAAKAGGRGPAPKLADREEDLKAAVAAHPDRTPAEHREHLGLPVSVSTVARTLRRLGLTRKKSRPTPPSRSGRT